MRPAQRLANKQQNTSMQLQQQLHGTSRCTLGRSHVPLVHRRIQRQHTCRVATETSAAPATKDPFAEKTVYNDNMVDKLFIRLFTQKMADQLEGVDVPEEVTYEEFVRVSKEIMRGRTPEQQRVVVKKVLQSLLPEQTAAVFRALFPPNQLSATLNAAVASIGFYWLVGESELKVGDVQVAPGVTRQQRSVVAIKKCRYLEASGCVGLCVNMCKLPTQEFFTEDFGLPLTMNPNFEDLSCEMIFGQAPPPLEADAVATQPCFIPQCSLATERKAKACPKMDAPPAAAGSNGSIGSSESAKLKSR